MAWLTERDLKRFIAKGQLGQRARAGVDAILEKDWQQQVKDLARMLGWKTYHTLRSKGSDPGFPDLVMARSNFRRTMTRLIVAELKREGENPTAGQQEWLNFFKDISAEVYVWRPSDLEEVKRVLR